MAVVEEGQCAVGAIPLGDDIEAERVGLAQGAVDEFVEDLRVAGGVVGVDEVGGVGGPTGRSDALAGADAVRVVGVGAGGGGDQGT